MTKLLYIFLVTTFYVANISSQYNWEIYGGLNHSNIIHSINGQQILYAHTLNAPLWNYGFQIGANRVWKISDNSLFLTGIRLQLKGDRKSINEISIGDNYESLRFYDFMIPVNFKYKILHSKQIFIKFGMSCNYLLYQNKNGHIFPFFPIDTFKEKLGLSMQIGFNFLIKKRISTELIYSQGLTNIYRKAIPPMFHYPDESSFTYKHQAFEVSILYGL